MDMMPRGSTGYIEFPSYVAALLASDAMCKAANVTLCAVRKPGGGRVSICVFGPLADCQAAIMAGVVAAQRQGALLERCIIGRPETDTVDLWEAHIPGVLERKAAKQSGQAKFSEQRRNSVLAMPPSEIPVVEEAPQGMTEGGDAGKSSTSPRRAASRKKKNHQKGES